jgi:hypothetical protein
LEQKYLFVPKGAVPPAGCSKKLLTTDERDKRDFKSSLKILCIPFIGG